MNELLGPWVRRFLVEYVIRERNRCTVDGLRLVEIKPKLVREFTQQLAASERRAPWIPDHADQIARLGVVRAHQQRQSLWNQARPLSITPEQE